jgi:hypothetical protein
MHSEIPKVMKVKSQPKMPSLLSRIELAKRIKMTLKNYPDIMMIPVEKLSFVG